MKSSDESADTSPPIERSRLILGGALFAGGFFCPLAIPLVNSFDLPNSWKTALSAALVFGLPEVGMILAAAVLGKDGFAWLKRRLLALLRRHTEVAAISATRYRIGLVLFLLPLLIGWIQPYLWHFLPSLTSSWSFFVPAIALDVMFASSFVVLGAGFWEKIRSLFSHP